ncbi:hypothetical protein R1sor_012969 [Riccia sorocarpa]|uniref:Tetratricopeptide repeat-like superfamily protein n=1 Tax=Riccia sorocarpa TaxID=122646 RepID=A0ABD3I5C5_9MARC
MAIQASQLACQPFCQPKIWKASYLSAGLQQRALSSVEHPHWKLCLGLTQHIFASQRWRVSSTRTYAAKPGFGAQPKKSKSKDRSQREKEVKDPVLRAQQILSKKQQESVIKTSTTPEESGAAPRLGIGEEEPTRSFDETEFEMKLADIQRLAEEQKKREEAKKYEPIDYDAPLPASQKGLAENTLAKFGIGLSVVVFGLLFALGDNVPSFSPKAEKSGLVEKMQLKPDEVGNLQNQVKGLLEILKNNPDDRIALEGVGVIYAQLGEFDKAADYLSKIVQKSPRNVEAQRLLAEVQAGKGDYDASIAAYRAAIRASPQESMSLLQGLTDTLLASKKPGEAVGELLAARARLKTKASQQLLAPNGDGALSSKESTVADTKDYEQIDPIQVELLLGKSYAAWGKPGDAVSIYDGLIASYQDDFRGYLAKGILLKDQGKTADSERMFIQARYLAPPEAKATVDKYSGRQAMAS